MKGFHLQILVFGAMLMCLVTEVARADALAYTYDFRNVEDTNFYNSNNWYNETLTTYGTLPNAFSTSNSVSVIRGNADGVTTVTVDVNAAPAANYAWSGPDTGLLGPVMINVTGPSGYLNCSENQQTGYIGHIKYGKLTVTNGGKAVFGGSSTAALRVGNDANSTGVVTVDGAGTYFAIARGCMQVPGSNNAGVSSVVTLQNGAGFEAREGSGANTHTIGNTNATTKARLRLLGSGTTHRWWGQRTVAVLGTASQDGANVTFQANATLEVGIDSGGITPMEVKEDTTPDGTKGNVTFSAGTTLDVVDLGGAVNGTYVVLIANEIINNGLVLGNAPTGTSFAITGTANTSQQLEVTLTQVPVELSKFEIE